MRRRSARPQSRPRTSSERSLGSLWPLGSARTPPRRLWAVPGPVATLPLSVYVPPFRFALRVASTPQAPLSVCSPFDAPSLRLRPPLSVCSPCRVDAAGSALGVLSFRRSLSPFTSPPFGLLSVSRRRRRLGSRCAIPFCAVTAAPAVDSLVVPDRLACHQHTAHAAVPQFAPISI